MTIDFDSCENIDNITSYCKADNWKNQLDFICPDTLKESGKYLLIMVILEIVSFLFFLVMVFFLITYIKQNDKQKDVN